LFVVDGIHQNNLLKVHQMSIVKMLIVQFLHFATLKNQIWLATDCLI